MASAGEFDVVVVGASVAGCTVARLFAQQGARVALVERRHDPAAYKVACTHAILPPATPVIERLGLAPLLLDRGVPRTWAELWTPYGGWSTSEDIPDGWGVTRRTLDPLLRGLAVDTPGVEFFAGWTARRILTERGRAAGIEAESRNQARVTLHARLVVGADGRESALARLAEIPGRTRPHNRFFYFSYWRGIEQARTTRGPSIRLWLLDPDGAAQFSNEDDLTVLVTTFHKSRLAHVRSDIEGAHMRALAELPDGPDLAGAERVSKIVGKLEVPNIIRTAAAPGLAFVGDAAMACDPLFGVGISFAFQSAAWLVDATSRALDRPHGLDAALSRYRRKFAWHFLPHHLQIADFSTGRKLRPIERRTFRKAATDPIVARALGQVFVRTHSPLRLTRPSIISRLIMPSRMPTVPRSETPRPGPTETSKELA